MNEDIYPDPPQSLREELPCGTELCHGQYRIEKYLNSGGFGITYLALDSLGRKVVIKECFPGAMCFRTEESVRIRSRSHQTDFERVLALFEKEAHALAHIQHPNVVGVHQIFKDNGTAYMALDYIEGLDLLDVIELTPERLDPQRTVRLLRELLEALSHVHANGILHRDISPDNILLDNADVPVLIDFGAAREGAARASRILSRIHTVKDGYSPQEFYLAGSKQGPSSDLYALAATFHHIIAGSPPPNSNLRLAAVAEKKSDPLKPLADAFLDYDPLMLETVDRCLSLFPKDRIDSATAWLDRLDGRGGPRRKAAPPADGQIDLRIAELVEQNILAIREQETRDPSSPGAPGAPRHDGRAAEAPRRAVYGITVDEDLRTLFSEIPAEDEKPDPDDFDMAFAALDPEAEPDDPPEDWDDDLADDADPPRRHAFLSALFSKFFTRPRDAQSLQPLSFGSDR
ncbi:serine/threonine-protein kinase [Thetidibacter halocola]|uniref:Serine/threonine protein kinase n=1 Tax=Thetidibacter halocola TaxID=2827239 RepID=A0A8J7WBF8_9RHOB|nr:serine/threonine-protein kinase [Thetidibacter halocola]MBS0123687.1 serine/threonine protein kinase [Thetidibacter halocola]